jgi:hypothetical protein
MKKLIVEEVNSFRAEVRAQARASGQIRRQERYALRLLLFETCLSVIYLVFLFRRGTKFLVLPSKSMGLFMELHQASLPRKECDALQVLC